MDAYLRLLVSCRLIATIIRQRKKDIGKYISNIFISLLDDCCN